MQNGRFCYIKSWICGIFGNFAMQNPHPLRPGSFEFFFKLKIPLGLFRCKIKWLRPRRKFLKIESPWPPPGRCKTRRPWWSPSWWWWRQRKRGREGERDRGREGEREGERERRESDNCHSTSVVVKFMFVRMEIFHAVFVFI